ncbi:hypothetical protein [Pseudonocardia endophytica]|nr:hypothetical protein [Pseudonocardia endophytica]
MVREGVRPLLVLASLAAMADAVAAPVGPDPVVGSIAMAVAAVVRAWTYAAAVVVLLVLRGRRAGSALSGLARSARRLPLLVGWLAVGVVATVAGLALLVLPGIWLLVVLTATLVAVVTIEGGSPLRCLRLVRGRWWATALRVLLAVGPVALWWAATGAAVAALPVHPVAAAVLTAVLAVPGYAVVAAFLAAAYVELRRREDPGYGPVPLPSVAPGAALPRPAGTPALDRTGPSPVLLGVGGGVLLAAALVAVLVVTTWPGPERAPAPPLAAVGPERPPATAAEVLSATYARSRLDRTGIYRADPGDLWEDVGYVGSRGEFALDGDSTSVHARLTDTGLSVRETIVVDDRRWIRSRYPEPVGHWVPCSIGDGSVYADACVYTVYQQDLADPVAVLMRAGRSATVVGSGAEVVDDVPATWFDVRLAADRAAADEPDPAWRTRFAESLLGAAPVRVWTGPDGRLLQLAFAAPSDNRVRYTGWGLTGPVLPPR